MQGNSSDYNGLASLDDGIVVLTSTKTSLIDNSCIGNSAGGIEIGLGSTDTYVQNNTTTQNGIVGINDDDNAGEVIAFFNKSCDNGVVNCVNVPLAQAPGDNTYIFGSNLCCDDPDAPTAKAGAKKAFGPIAPAPIAPDPTGAPEAEEAPDLSQIPQF